MNNISAYFIRNPLPAILLFILLTVGGMIGYSNMIIKLWPDIEVPIITITVPVPGGAPEQLETEVARKIEDKVSNLSGIKHIHTTVEDNVAIITVEFVINKSPQEALDDVRSAVNEVRGDLPPSAESPIVTKLDINDMPLFIYSISSDELDAADLSWFVDNELTKRLMGVKGVGDITRIGGVEREVQVLLDPTKLQAYQITVSEITRQVKNMQQNFSGGQTDLGGLKQPIRTIAAVNHPQDLEDVRITLSSGRIIKLTDIAAIKDTISEQTSKAILADTEGVAFAIKRGKSHGDLDVGYAVLTELDEIRASYPSLEITQVFEMLSMTEEDYNGAVTMLAEGAALAVFVVLLFLGGARPTFFFALAMGIAYYLVHTIKAPWVTFVAVLIALLPVVIFFNRFRATIVAAIALPLSIIPAMAGMYLLGLSINMMVTIALSLVIGILVDDAIVEIENIDRHMSMGKTPYQASIDAASEIGTAVIAITMTLIAVFLPTAFMPGIAGKFFYQFGVAASLSIFASLLVARIITPMLCAYFLVPVKHEEKDPFWMKPYLWFAKWAIKLRWVTLLVSILFFIGSMMVMGSLPKTFIPPNNASFTQIKIELPPGGKIDKTEAVAQQVKASISDIDHITKIFSWIGAGDVRNATLFLTFTDSRKARPSRLEIEAKIRERLKDIPGARFMITSGGNGERYELNLTSSDSEALVKRANAIVEELRTLEGIGSISNKSALSRQELIIYPNYVKAAERGVSTAAIAHAIRVATVGEFESQLPKFNSDQRQIPIVIRLEDDARKDISSLSDLLVMGTKGPVRIGDVADIDVDLGTLKIDRYDRSRFVQILVETAGGELGELEEQINALPSVKNLPPNIEKLAVGEAESMAELAGSFVTAMGIAILCILMVLMLLFGQVAQPITILVALPLSIGGAVAGLLLVDAGMSLPAMIGFLMLMGIAVKNSILLVEYAIEFRKNNPQVSRIEAILDACHKRARPIIMTTIAMGAGMIPLIIGLGEADPSFRRPMAAAVFGGLMTSTILSLIVIPAFYTIMEDLSKLFGKLFRVIFNRDKLAPKQDRVKAN